MNIEEIVEKIGVEKLAIAAANKNLPPTKSTKPDSNEDDIRQSALDHGMVTLREAGLARVLDGTITIEEVIRSTVEEL